MAAPVSSIRNLGPASDAAFASAGITSAEQLRDLGPDAAYYAMVMGLQGRPWNDCQGAEKTALRARFDAIKARVTASGATPNSEIEAILNRIGTGTRR
jgi:DNA transformation protein